ncbi:hypothetical protein N9N67_04885 [Bacteriovoracaceae bacterium]|nr:hypothetical protein [Bacteriovoracaceae bacterium]
MKIKLTSSHYLLIALTISFSAFSQHDNLLQELHQNGHEYKLVDTISDPDDVYECPESLEIKLSESDPSLYEIEGVVDFQSDLSEKEKIKSRTISDDVVSKKKTKIKANSKRAKIIIREKDRDSLSEIIKTSHRLKFLKDNYHVIIDKKDENQINLFFKYKDKVNNSSAILECLYEHKTTSN